MKKHRRIEIMAFKRRVTIVSGEYEAFVDEDDNIRPVEEHALETVEPESAEVKRILADAVRLLKEKLSG